jgi:hypothetical protein
MVKVNHLYVDVKWVFCKDIFFKSYLHTVAWLSSLFSVTQPNLSTALQKIGTEEKYGGNQFFWTTKQLRQELCLTEVFGPSRPNQLASVNMEGARMCLCIVAVLYYVLF